MDEKELKEIFEFLQKAGANPQLCDTEVPYFESITFKVLPYRIMVSCKPMTWNM